MERRHVAVGLALGAVAVALVFAYQTYVCGMRSVSETCTSAEECEAKSECVSRLHPMALPYTLLGIAAVALAWTRLAYPLIVAGVVGVLLGIAFGLSMGLVGIGVGALVLSAGVVVLPRAGDKVSA